MCDMAVPDLLTLTVTTPTSGKQIGHERHSSVTSIRYKWDFSPR